VDTETNASTECAAGEYLDGDGSFLQDGPYQMPDGTSFWVDWSSGNHTAAPIPVTASGPFSEMLNGEYHLTRIFETMAAFMDEPR
jgi:alkaline phosphatase